MNKLNQAIATDLRLLAEFLPHAIDERCCQPVHRVTRCAVDTAHVPADERLHEIVVILELSVDVGDYAGELVLGKHVGNVGVRE